MDIRKYLEMGVSLPLGISGENGIESYEFGYGDWASLYGDGVLSINHQRPGDSSPYPVGLTVSGHIAHWDVTAADVQYSGHGRIQVVYAVNGIMKKSMTGTTVIEPSLGENVGADPAIQSYIDTMVEIKDEAYQSMVTAVNAKDVAVQKAQDVLGLTAEATINNNVGTPNVDVAVTQDGDHKKMSFSFENLKGDPGRDYGEVFVTPEMFGAKGDGVADDTEAVQQAVDSGKTVVFANTYLISGITAQDIHLLLNAEATLKRKDDGESVFININPNRAPSGYITKNSFIHGGKIDANGADICVAINGAEQFTVETYITDCTVGLYLGYTDNAVEYPQYIIETRVDNTKLKNTQAFADSYGIINDGTDSQFTNIVIENFKYGVKIGGGDAYINVHHWSSIVSQYSGSASFIFADNKCAALTNCVSDSIETAFVLGDYSRALVANFMQICASTIQSQSMWYLRSDYPNTLYFFSANSSHSGNNEHTITFYMLDDGVYARYLNQKQTFDSHVNIVDSVVINMASNNNMYLSGFRGLGPLQSLFGLQSYSWKANQNMNSLTDNGFYGIDAATASNCPVSSGATAALVFGSPYSKAQVILNSSGAYFRMYNGANFGSWKQITIT